MQRKQADFDALVKEGKKRNAKQAVFYQDVDEPLEERRHFDLAEKFYKQSAELRAEVKLTDKSMTALRAAKVPEPVLTKLDPLEDKVFETRELLANEVAKVLTKEE